MTRTLAPLGLVLALVQALSACTLPQDDWRIADATKQNQTEWRIDRAYVRFLDRAIQPIDGDLGRLTRFLESRDIKETDRVQVEASGVTDPFGFGAERVRAVTAHLRGLGYDPVVVPSVRRATVNPLGVDSVRVTVGRFVAIAPDCPNWLHPSNAGSKNQKSSNYGCADKNNLATMIDQPRDLIIGRGSGSRLKGEAGIITAQPDIKAVETYGGSASPGVTISGGSGGNSASDGDSGGVADGKVPSASGSGTLP